MKQHRNLYRILCLLLCAVLLVGCGGRLVEEDSTQKPPKATATPGNQGGQNDSQAEDALDALAMELFEGVLTEDSLSFWFYIDDPSVFDISAPSPATLGTVKYTTDTAEDAQEVADYRTRLEAIDRGELSVEGQRTWDLIDYQLTTAQNWIKYPNHYSTLSTLSNDLATLPLSLGCMPISCEAAARDAVALTRDVQRYLQEVFEYEKARIENGFKVRKETVQDVADSCQAIVDDKANDFLLPMFTQQVDALNLAADVRQTLLDDYAAALDEALYPAYAKLATDLESLLPRCDGTGSWANDLPDGEAFYEFYLQNQSASDWTNQGAIDALQTKLDADLQRYFTLLNRNPDLAEAELVWNKGTAQDNLEACKQAIADIYPELPDHESILRDVPAALEDSFAPAAYFSCPIDNPKRNVVVVNQKTGAGDELLLTMAHESYPGHLYHRVYYMSLEQSLFRKLVSFTGVHEGWAQMAEEFMADAYAPADQAGAAEYHTIESRLDIWVYMIADIGVNGLGWSDEDLAAWLEPYYGAGAGEYAEGLSDWVRGDPGYWAKYSLGLLSMLQLRDDYNAANPRGEFVTAFLDCGSGPFTLIRKWMKLSRDA